MISTFGKVIISHGACGEFLGGIRNISLLYCSVSFSLSVLWSSPLLLHPTSNKDFSFQSAELLFSPFQMPPKKRKKKWFAWPQAPCAASIQASLQVPILGPYWNRLKAQRAIFHAIRCWGRKAHRCFMDFWVSIWAPTGWSRSRGLCPFYGQAGTSWRPFSALGGVLWKLICQSGHHAWRPCLVLMNGARCLAPYATIHQLLFM